MAEKDVLYDKGLAAEWSEWVETPNPEGSREKELFPELVQWLSRICPSTVLDIGCGQGIISTLIPEEIRYLGIDISEALIARARVNYACADKSFQVGDAYQLPIEPGYFDAAISFWVWSHLEYPKRAAAEMARVLKPNGSYIVVTANPATYHVRRKFYTSYEERDGCIVGDFDLGSGKQLSNTTLYLHSMQDLRDAATQAGLSIESTKSMGMLSEHPDGLYVIISGRKGA